jgi:hypothetical protein
LARRLEQFLASPDWASAHRAIRRAASRWAPLDWREDVVSEARLRMFERSLSGDPIEAIHAYAKMVVRSILREMRGKSVVLACGDIEDLVTTELPPRVSFDQLTVERPADVPTLRGRVQQQIVKAVISGTNLESICDGDPARLAKLRFLTSELADRIERLREISRESEGPDSR